MWRTLASLMLTMAAFAWAILASAVCFFYASAFWRDVLGHFGAFWGALTAFIASLVGARLLLALADKLLEPYSGPFDGSVYAGSPRDTFYHNWRRYADEIARNRRIAFYGRTRQWDRMTALQAEAAAAPSGPDLPPMDAERATLVPHRLSMEGQLSLDEVTRAARRGAYSAPQRAATTGWAFADDD